MSTETLSSDNTYSVTEAILRFLFPEISSQGLESIHALIRKTGHVSEYFVLGLLLFRAFRGDSAVFWKWRWPILAVSVLALWAGSDELHQRFVSTRTTSLIDVGIDVVGGILAQCAIVFWYRRRWRRRPSEIL